jgi:CHAD domain-containing protein
LEIGVLSKEERGFMLARNMLGREQKAAALDIRRGMDVRQAIVMIVHECVRHFRLNEPAIIADRNPEALHQARVAIRRLRTVLSFFRPVISRGALDPLREELRSFTVPFGKARNLDVFLAHHGKHLISSDRRKLTRAREEAYDQVIEAMGAQRTRDMFLELVTWAVARDWQKDGATAPIGKFAAKRLDAAWKKIKRKGSMLPDLEERQLHRFRIHVKKLRYAVEFMAALYSRKEIRKFTASLEKIQDCFGLLHDDMIARQLIDEFSLDFRASTGGSEQARRLKEAETHFKRLKRLGRVWSR